MTTEITIDTPSPEAPSTFEALWNAESPRRGVSRVAIASWFATAVSSAAVAAGVVALPFNGVDAVAVWLLAALAIAMPALAFTVRQDSEIREWPRTPIVLMVAALLSCGFLLLTPEYSYGREINGILHRSIFSGPLMIGVGVSALSTSLFHAMGGGPTAWDRSRYPIILLPIGLILAAYGAILFKLISEGAPDLSLDLITTAYSKTNVGTEIVAEAGLRNQLLGTMLLVAMTAAIALPIGVGAGAYMSEYDGFITTVIRFSTLVLRAISVFILGVTAFTLADWSAQYAPGDLRSDIFRGFYRDAAGFKIAGHGSYITASLVLSMLVIPVIARATEEGFRSVPREIREGSLALGATEGHGFLRILLPWSIPNITTGLLLGSAEAAGSVAVLLFISGTGEFGVGPLRDVTSLSYLVYYADRGPKTFIDAMGEYRFASALLLIMLTFSFSIAAMLIRRRFSQRYDSASLL